MANISKWNFRKDVNINNIFNDCIQLGILPFSNFSENSKTSEKAQINKLYELLKYISIANGWLNNILILTFPEISLLLVKLIILKNF